MEKIGKQGIRDYPFNEINPFLDTLVVNSKSRIIAKGKNADKAIINTTTGEVGDDTLFIALQKEVDKEQFVKIFQSQLKIFFDLSTKTLRVLSYLLSVATFEDQILFRVNECMKYTGYNSKNTINQAIAELLEKGIIAKGYVAHLFYINPTIFYKGDRIVLLTEYRKVKKKPIEYPNQSQLFDT
jgi:hypothetical protein